MTISWLGLRERFQEDIILRINLVLGSAISVFSWLPACSGCTNQLQYQLVPLKNLDPRQLHMQGSGQRMAAILYCQLNRMKLLQVQLLSLPGSNGSYP
ncbi:hypothetical protein CsSME_00011143 [Camellia sinensis var. sinensis]